MTIAPGGEPSFEIELWKSPHASYVGRLQYHPDRPIERELVLTTIKRCRSRKYQFHSLYSSSDGRHCGLLVLSRRTISDRDCLVIELLFTSYPYRKLAYDQLGADGPLPISQFLVLYAIQLAVDQGFAYIALQPLKQAEEKLIPLYERSGFKRGEPATEDNWMFLELPQDTEATPATRE